MTSLWQQYDSNMTGWWQEYFWSITQGSDPGGGKRGPLQKKKSSESIRAAGRPGPADPVATTFLYTIWQRDQVVFWIYYQSKSRPTENYPLCHAGLSYRRCFPYSDRNSHCYSFLSPTFELASFPHLHPGILLLSYPFLASLWLQKVWPHFIFGHSMKKGSWSSAFDFKRSGTQAWYLIWDVRLSNSHTQDTHQKWTAGQGRFATAGAHCTFISSIIRFRTCFQRRSYHWICKGRACHSSSPFVAVLRRRIRSGRNNKKSWIKSLICS